MNARVAVVGGHGKTGRAVSAALTARGACPVPLGRAAWGDLAGALAGCRTAYVIAPNMHPDEAAYVEDVAAAATAAGVRRLVLHSVASPYVPAMPHHLGKARAEDVVRRSGLALDDPAAGRLRAEPAAGRTVAPAGLPRRRAVRVRRPRRPGGGGGDGAAGGRARRRDLRARVVRGDRRRRRGGRRGRGRGGQAARTGPAPTAPGSTRASATWLLAMFAYYERHGLPVGTLPMRALLGRPPTHPVGALARRWTAGEHGRGADSMR